MYRVNNRVVETLTFFQWLNKFELITKTEFRTLSQEEQSKLKEKYEAWRSK